MSPLTLVATAWRRAVERFVILGSLAATALVILAMAMIVGFISRLAQRNGERSARPASTSTPLPGPDSGGGMPT
jgi:hypothetical protein